MNWSTHADPHPRDSRLIYRPCLDANAAQRGLWSESDPFSQQQQHLHDALRDALASVLTDKQRTAVELYFFEGLSQGDIARRLGVSQQVIHRRLYGDRRNGRMVGGALSRLRQALSGEALARVTP
ncbi:MAG: RNA polymerase sigma factor (sigma-70 family) [Myxococcota bacterium]|jgi:RNA polymerase sigma factor (sigma-70 family)